MRRHAAIYVPLLDEGVEVWRAVQAELLADGTFLILEPSHDQDDERWAFEPGERVVCVHMALDGEAVLVANARAVSPASEPGH